MKSFNKVSIFGLALLISCSAPVLAGRKNKDKRALNRLIKEQIQQGEASTEAILEVAPEFNQRAIARRLEHQLRKEQARQERATLALEHVAPQQASTFIENPAEITQEHTVLPVQSQSGWMSRLWTATKAKATAIATGAQSLANRAIEAVTPTIVEIPSDFGHMGMINQTSFAQHEDHSDTSSVRSPSFDHLSDMDEEGIDEIINPVVDFVIEESVVAPQAPLAIEYHPELTQQPEVLGITRGVPVNTPEMVTLPQEAMDIVMEQMFPQPQPAPLAIEYHPELTTAQTDAVLGYGADQSDNASSIEELSPRSSNSSLLLPPSFERMELCNLSSTDSLVDVDLDETLSDIGLEHLFVRRHSIEAIPDRDAVNPDVTLSRPLQVIEDYVPAVVVPETEQTAQVDEVIEEPVAPAENPAVDIESQQPLAPAQQGWFASLASFATEKAKAAATYINQNPAEVAAILLGAVAVEETVRRNLPAAQPSVETVLSIPCKEGASLQLTTDGKLTYVGTTANALHKANVLQTDIIDAKEGYVDLRTAEGNYFVRISKETVTETIENTVVEYAQYTFQLVKEEVDGLWVYEDEGVELETTIKVDLTNKTIVPVNEQEQAQRSRVISLITKLAAATQPAPQEAALASN